VGCCMSLPLTPTLSTHSVSKVLVRIINEAATPTPGAHTPAKEAVELARVALKSLNLDYTPSDAKALQVSVSVSGAISSCCCLALEVVFRVLFPVHYTILSYLIIFSYLIYDVTPPRAVSSCRC
jgi:hypothetical protein